MANEELYGENAVTGTIEDARNVTVTTPGMPTSFTVTPEDTKGVDQAAPQEETTPPPPQQQQGEETLTPEQQVSKEAQEQIKADAEVAKTLESKGVDIESLQTEYETNGSLSAASYEALEKAGYSKSVVNAYIAGIEATSERFTNAVYTAAGGAEEYARMGSFISSLGKAHVDNFNKIIDSGDIMQIQVALQGYKAQMVEKQGTRNSTYLGGAGSQVIGGFTSTSEMTKAINDARYMRDAKYTKEVQAKIIKTNF